VEVVDMIIGTVNRLRRTPRMGSLLLPALIVAAGLGVWGGARALAAQPLPTVAFLARADNPVDALAASSQAGQLGAPVLLTATATLSPEASDALAGMRPAIVVIAGGPAAISPQVEAQVQSLLPSSEVLRVAGPTRTGTAAQLAQLGGRLGYGRPVVTVGTVTGDVAIDGRLTVAGADIAAEAAALRAQVTDLAGVVAAHQARLAQLDGLLAGVSRQGTTLRFDGVNVQVTNGTGATWVTNGLGNLIVGYNEDHTTFACVPSPAQCQYNGDGAADVRTGSHNVIVGVDHTYSSYGGLVAAQNNAITARFATVTGGDDNTASGIASSVSGGRSNTASGLLASVAGGQGNEASGEVATVTGGRVNRAEGQEASVSGGQGNVASGQGASVSGGMLNLSTGLMTSVLGGGLKSASADFACHPACS
jgi:hypothetical protein